MAEGKKNFSLLHYYIPEDKDDLEILNAFAIKKASEEIRLKDIEENFPLEGQYHFRFKYKYMDDYVWMDINNQNCKLPLMNNKIIMKVTRKTWAPQHDSIYIYIYIYIYVYIYIYILGESSVPIKEVQTAEMARKYENSTRGKAGNGIAGQPLSKPGINLLEGNFEESKQPNPVAVKQTAPILQNTHVSTFILDIYIYIDIYRYIYIAPKCNAE